MATSVTICTVLPEPVGCSIRTSSVARQTSVTNRTWYGRSCLVVGAMLANPCGSGFRYETFVHSTWPAMVVSRHSELVEAFPGVGDVQRRMKVIEQRHLILRSKGARNLSRAKMPTVY